MLLAPDTWVLLAGLHSLGFAVFHLGFWRLLRWPGSLQPAGPANRAVTQILNLRLTYVFLGMAALCFTLPDALLGSTLGRALLLGMSGFWLGRTIEQFVFFDKASLRGRQDPLLNALTLLFVLGAVLFALPVVLLLR